MVPIIIALAEPQVFAALASYRSLQFEWNHIQWVTPKMMEWLYI